MSQDHPSLISAVVSTYNAARYLAGCLEDLEAQTLADQLEIIVVDSGSEQNEGDIVASFRKRFANIRYIRTEQREGLYAAWNRGIRASTGKYITNANTDDRHLPSAFEVQAGTLEAHPDAGMVYGDILVTGRSTDILQWPDIISDKEALSKGVQRFRLCRYPDFSPLVGLTGSNFSPQPMWRRSVHDEIGYFDEGFTVAGDYDFFYHVAWKFGAIHIPRPLGLYFENTEGIEKSNKEATVREFSRLRRKYYALVPLPAFVPFLSEAPEDRDRQGYAWWRLGDNCLAASPLPEFELACGFYGKAIDALGERPRLLHNLAVSLIGDGRLQEGERFLEKAAAGIPESLSILEALRRSETAHPGLATYFPPEADQPAFGNATAGKTDGRDRNRNGEERRSANGAGADKVQALLDRAAALRQEGRIDQAVQTLLAGLRLAPTDLSIYHALADLLIREALYPDALHILKTMPASPDDIRRWQLINLCYGKMEPPETTDVTVSLCMIARNEGEHLGRCLTSARPIVQEIVVVDTGSTDRTREIAAAFGAKVYDVPWGDHFSEARNVSLAKASGTWILVLDADEVISEQDIGAFRDLIRSADPHTAYDFVTRNYIADFQTLGWTPNTGAYGREEAGYGWFPSNKVRLFPRSEAVRFEYPIHEIVENSLAREGIAVRKSGIPIHHYGKLNREKDLTKGEAYYLLGRAKLAEMGDNPKFLSELAIQASGLGRDEESIGLWREVVRLDPSHPEAFTNMSALLIRLGRYEEAMEASRRARAVNPYSGGALYNLSICEFFSGDLDRAVAGLDDLLRHVPGYVPARALQAAAHILRGRPQGQSILTELQASGVDFTPFFQDLIARLKAGGQPERAALLSEGTGIVPPSGDDDRETHR